MLNSVFILDMNCRGRPPCVPLGLSGDEYGSTEPVVSLSNCSPQTRSAPTIATTGSRRNSFLQHNLSLGLIVCDLRLNFIVFYSSGDKLLWAVSLRFSSLKQYFALLFSYSSTTSWEKMPSLRKRLSTSKRLQEKREVE